jgi:lipopolysaccharide transport system ATP-binding protein
MTKTVISVEGIGKSYHLNHSPAEGMRHALTRIVTSPFRKSEPAEGQPDEDFWALKDASFEVKQGEVVGVVGRNGSGKSTLLKILSRITDPTAGRVRTKGRVASLLEVGTGFHPELTGRENVFLNGAILGMRQSEIKRKFDEIVSFSEVEKFLDTPVKRYSSGMYVRLAFAVAAHLDPNILIVDEVLAVGDAQFQAKCLGKMQDVSLREGKTVIFVSHQMGAVSRLCTRAILLKSGVIVMDGATESVARAYLETEIPKGAPGEWLTVPVPAKANTATFHSVSYQGKGPGIAPRTGGAFEVTARIHSDIAQEIPFFTFWLNGRNQNTLIRVESRSMGKSLNLKSGINEVRVSTDVLNLIPGAYTLGLALGRPGQSIDYRDPVCELFIADKAGEFINQDVYDGQVAGTFAMVQL